MHEQAPWIEKARYLLDRGYILEPIPTLEELARKMYLSTIKETN